MTDDVPVAPETRLARRALLDALEALAPQLDALVLVGAQAIYLRVREDPSIVVPAFTTDGDLAIDAEVLQDDPELTKALQDADFAPGGQPGRWRGDRGVFVDLMVVPHQAGTTRPDARAARLSPHKKNLARITPGIEPALVDNEHVTIRALEEGDPRTSSVRVAGPAAMLVAKAVKLEERLNAGTGERVRAKDALDMLRILSGTEPDELVAGFARHRREQHARTVSQRALSFLRSDAQPRAGGAIAGLLRGELGGPTLAVRYEALLDEVLEEIDITLDDVLGTNED